MPRAHASRRLVAALTLGFTAVGLAAAVPARADQCTDITKILEDRKGLIASINTLGKGKNKQMAPGPACAAFGKLVANGTALVKFIEVNKDWCQIPDQFAANLKGDHEKTVGIRGQACQAAAKQAQMEKMARQQAQGGAAANSQLGGPGLTGQYRMPQGAL